MKEMTPVAAHWARPPEWRPNVVPKRARSVGGNKTFGEDE
jgi:hypothetical protein